MKIAAASPELAFQPASPELAFQPASPELAFQNGRRIPDASRARQEFESFLVAEVWKQSQRGPRWSELLSTSQTTRMVNEMWIEELVGRAVATRSLGLAASLPGGAAGPVEDSG